MNLPSKLNTWVGRSIGDRQRYRIEKLLGEGGMGDVFLAMDTLLCQQVALKLLKSTLVAADVLKKRFEREVMVCAALKSRHIIDVRDYGVTPEGHPFYVMEYLRGQSLRQLLQREQRLSVERTVSILIQVCEGLQLAHEGVTVWRQANASEHIKVVHRDLKPDNIFLVNGNQQEQVKILDFGIAKICHETSEQTNLTSMFMGTFHYAAPEQFGVTQDLDGRADVYSLGIILYEMLSGTDPFGLGLNINKISASSWIVAHASKLPIPLRLQRGCEHLSPALEAVVMRCLQKLPADRFERVHELSQALQAAVAVVATRNTTTPEFQEQEYQDFLEYRRQKLKSTLPELNEFATGYSELPHTTNEETYKLTPLRANFNPSPPSGASIQQTATTARERKQKVRRLTAIVVVAIVGVGVLANYKYIQWQSEQSTQANIERAKSLKASKKYQECVYQIKEVPQKSRFYANAQNLLNECYLDQAKVFAQNNQLKDAIAVASKIPVSSSLHSAAVLLVEQWSWQILKYAEELYKQADNSTQLEKTINLTKAIPKTSSVAKQAEQVTQKWRSEWRNNETYLQAAQKALKERKWQEAINKTGEIKLLGQEIKPDTRYWSNNIKPIVEVAQKQIATINRQKVKSNTATKPVRSPRIVRYRPPQQTVRSRRPSQRTVRLQSPQRAVRSRPSQRVVPQSPQRAVRRPPQRAVRSRPPQQSGWTREIR